MLSVTLTKLILAVYCRAFTNEIVKAYAQDHFFDVITNIIGLIAVLLANYISDWMDPVGAIIVSGNSFLLSPNSQFSPGSWMLLADGCNWSESVPTSCMVQLMGFVKIKILIYLNSEFEEFRSKGIEHIQIRLLSKVAICVWWDSGEGFSPFCGNPCCNKLALLDDRLTHFSVFLNLLTLFF